MSKIVVSSIVKINRKMLIQSLKLRTTHKTSLYSLWKEESVESSWSWKLEFILVGLSNENDDVTDVMNSNRKLDVLLDGTLLSHTTNLNAFVLTPNTEREKISTSGCHLCRPRRQRSHCCLRLRFPIINVEWMCVKFFSQASQWGYRWCGGR